MITEKPDRWVVLKVGDDLYKVFATWSGGYLGGDSLLGDRDDWGGLFD